MSTTLERGLVKLTVVGIDRLYFLIVLAVGTTVNGFRFAVSKRGRVTQIDCLCVFFNLCCPFRMKQSELFPVVNLRRATGRKIPQLEDVLPLSEAA